jgi:opacity protein-like surface antigen
MKKLFLTTITACVGLFASAQFSIMSSVDMPEEGEEWSMSSITDNMGAGYQINDKMMAGVIKNGENYDVFGRYYFENMYVSLQSSTEEMSENMKIGAGYSYNVWKNLYIEPSYSIPMKEDENGEREGKLVLGVAYKL